jgi:hypothetical protein
MKCLLSLSIWLGNIQARDSIATVLAEFTFVQQPGVRDLSPWRQERDLRNHLHLSQSWYRELIENEELARSKQREILSRVIAETIKSFVSHTNLVKLKELQVSILSEINIVHPERGFLGQGEIYKVVNKTQTKLYKLFLFSDALMYGTGTQVSGFSIHRVIQLAHAELRDRPGLAFDLLNPQKVVSFVALSEQDKEDWFLEIQSAISACKAERTQFAIFVSRLAWMRVIPEELSERLLQTSACIGKTKSMILDDDLTLYDDRCKLCFRVFSLFNRQKICMFCEDFVCIHCISYKARLPEWKTTSRKLVHVCDLCFNLLNPSRA